MPPPLWETRGYVAKAPMSFFATGMSIMLIVSFMMPAFGVAHHHHHVMPIGQTVAEGYHFGAPNMMILIMIIVLSNILYFYLRIGVDMIPDASEKQKNYFKWLYYASVVAGTLIFIIPQKRAHVGPFKYVLHEIVGNAYMILTAMWMMVFTQWFESSLGRNAVAVGCSLSMIGVVGNLIESGVHNARHGGPLQFFGLAVLLGTQLMLTFGAEMLKFVIFNADGFEASAPSSKAADDAEVGQYHD
jgi:hypothetical protein